VDSLDDAARVLSRRERVRLWWFWSPVMERVRRAAASGVRFASAGARRHQKGAGASARAERR